MKRIGIQRTDYTERNTILASNIHRATFELIEDDLSQLEPAFIQEMQSNWTLTQ